MVYEVGSHANRVTPRLELPVNSILVHVYIDHSLVLAASDLDTVVPDEESAAIESVTAAAELAQEEDTELHVELDRSSSPVEVIISAASNPLDYTYRSSNKQPITSSSSPQDSKRFKPNPGKLCLGPFSRLQEKWGNC